MDVSSLPGPPTADDRARAVGSVLCLSRDADDARMLLGLLGLDAEDVARYAASVCR